MPPPTPTPNLTPTPYPSSRGEIGCDGKEILSGYQVGFYYPQVKIASDIMIVSHFHNTWKGVPGRPTPTPQGYKPWHNTSTTTSFNYGFMVRVVSDEEAGRNVALVVRATHKGYWFFELRGCTGCHHEFSRHASAPNVVSTDKTRGIRLGRLLRIIDSGYFSADGVEFSEDKAGVNHMAFIAKGEECRFFVNGVEVPLEIDAEDRAAIEKYVGPFRYVSDGKWYGRYSSFGSARVAIRDGTVISPYTRGQPSWLITYPSVGACVP